MLCMASAEIIKCESSLRIPYPWGCLFSVLSLEEVILSQSLGSTLDMSPWVNSFCGVVSLLPFLPGFW